MTPRPRGGAPTTTGPQAVASTRRLPSHPTSAPPPARPPPPPPPPPTGLARRHRRRHPRAPASANRSARQDAAKRLVEAHIELAKAEFEEISGEIQRVAGLVASRLRALFAGLLLAIGLPLFLGELVFG